MALDDADIKKIQELIAAGQSPEALGKALGPVLAPLIKAATDPLTAELEALKKAKTAEQAGGKGESDGKGNAGGKGKDGEPDAAVQTEIAKLRAEIAESERKRMEAEAATARSALDTRARNLLATMGIPADRMKHALASLQAEGVFHQHNGDWHWKGKVGSVDGIHALEAGIADWVKGEGRVFLPAVSAAGTGEKVAVEPPRTQTGSVDWGSLSIRNSGSLSQVE